MKQIITLLAILFISLASANLVITDNPKTIDVKINEVKNFSITVLNNHTFNILDLTFNLDNYGFTFPENISINQGETKTIDFQVKTNKSNHDTIISNVEFKFLVDLPEEVTNYNLYISNQGIDNQYLTVRQGDTITFSNEDSIIHRIYSTEFGSISIAPNSSNTVTMNTQGSFSFYDQDFQEFGFFSGNIDVIDRTLAQKVHNPTYDQVWTINLNSILNPTNLTIENSQDTYNVTNKKSKNGQLTIKNIGLEKSELTKITSDKDWVVFDKTNINIEKDDTAFIGYTVLPYFFETNQTDKTYNVTFTIKASNTIEYTKSISVYIPYQEITQDFNNDYEYLVYMDTIFCPKRPCSAFCSPELPECQANYTGGLNGSGMCTLNLTEQSWYETKRELSELRNELSRVGNAYIDYQDDVSGKLGNLSEISNKSLINSEEAKKQERDKKLFLWITGSLLIIGSLIGGMLFMYNKKAKLDTRLRGNFKYKED